MPLSTLLQGYPRAARLRALDVRRALNRIRGANRERLFGDEVALAAYVRFVEVRHVTVSLEQGPAFEPLDQFALLLHFVSKHMFDLGATRDAAREMRILHATAASARSAALVSPVKTPDMAAGVFGLVDPTPHHSPVAQVDAILRAGRKGTYVATRYYMPPGEEPRFGAIATLALFQAVFNEFTMQEEYFLVAGALDYMLKAYDNRPGCWTSPQATRSVPDGAFIAAGRVLEDALTVG